MGRKKSKKKAVRVDSVRHRDKRSNIPTEELRDFVREDEKNYPTMLYPRDPSLDPQLVWKGKDEQDRAPLEVPVVPVYIQEKIHPQAIVEDVRAEARKRSDQGGPHQLTLFDDFNGLPEDFADRVDFYHHDANWSNRMILGDSLLVMTSLAEKEGLKGKVQMIYIDPPYGIKFGSNWQVSTRKRDVRDGRSEDTVRQPEQVKAFRDTWELGIHSYLSYLRERFAVTHDLLTESGSLFVQIGAENVHLVRCVLDEVMGADNFVSLITFATTSGFDSSELSRGGDYILWYAKGRSGPVKVRPILDVAPKAVESGYRWVTFPDGSRRGLSAREIRGEDPFPKDGRLYNPDNLISQGAASVDQPFRFCSMNYLPGVNSHWKAGYPQGMSRLAWASRIHVASNSIRYVRLADDYPLRARNNIWTDTLTGQFTDDKMYVVQTNTKVIERCMLMTTDPGDLVLDPTCGSGTTAYVAEQWGRRWITIDTSRVSIALARTRLMAGRFPYYLLADSPEGKKKEGQLTGQAPSTARSHDDIKKGFVYERVPHVMLSTIAHNEEIDVIHEKWQPKQDAARERLNKALMRSAAGRGLVGDGWEEWELPREADDKWSTAAREAHAEFWRLRRERQAEMDASIARHADQEILYDRPYEDKKRVRVTGPFTVESLSPHRILSTDQPTPRSESDTETEAGGGQFETMILENLRASGVKTTKRGEGIKFDSLDPFAGRWIQAAGEYTDKAGETRRVAVAIGPEHGTVAPQLIKEAAKEAVQGIGFDVLVVCGFAFDPHCNEEQERYGALRVMICRMNPDLAMGDELLKKTGSGNLFMVFGEPDVEIRKAKGEVTVEIRGVDVYDPTTGEVRSNSTDDIACWFIDTAYNGESFFVRHAYFCGGDDPYKKLRRALRAEIDEAAWSELYSTISRPFPIPETGRIGVKIINHYGDEALKVYEIT